MVTFRHGSVNDAPMISDLLVSLSKEFVVGEFSEEGQLYFLSELTPEKLAERLSGDFCFLLAEEDNALAGVAAVRGKTHLYYLFVAKSYQRRGLAKQLWAQIAKGSVAPGAVTVFTVNASNFAVKAYERLGFVRTGQAQLAKGVIFNPMECRICG